MEDGGKRGKKKGGWGRMAARKVRETESLERGGVGGGKGGRGGEKGRGRVE